MPALPRIAVAGVTAGAEARPDVAGVELDAAGMAEEEEVVSFGSTKPEVWAVAPAATGSMIVWLVELLIVIIDGILDGIDKV